MSLSPQSKFLVLSLLLAVTLSSSVDLVSAQRGGGRGGGARSIARGSSGSVRYAPPSASRSTRSKARATRSRQYGSVTRGGSNRSPKGRAYGGSVGRPSSSASISRPMNGRKAAADGTRHWGGVKSSVPPGATKVRYRGKNYYSYGGYYYKRGYYNGRVRYVGCRPPLGFICPNLPPGGRWWRYRDLRYYYWGGAYYLDNPEGDGYVVVEEPEDMESLESEEPSEIPATKPPDDPYRIVKDASEFLGKVGSFRLELTDTMDEVSDGQSVEVHSERTFRLIRPNRLRADFKGDRVHRSYYYSNSQLTMFDPDQKVYGTTKVPATIDEMLDFLSEKYGSTLPVVDLLYVDLFETVAKKATKAHYVGLHRVGRARCHHLAFENDTIDWEVWIEKGDEPLIKKLTITYKLEEGAPRYSAVMKNWYLNRELADKHFQFEVPEDAEAVEILPVATD